MADAYLIKLDVRRIADTLTDEPAAGRTPDAIAAWLRGLGLIDQGGGWWLCEDLQLDLFGPGEILDRRPFA